MQQAPIVDDVHGPVPAGSAGDLHVTQYLYAYPLRADQTLLFNTLTGAVDAVESGLADRLRPRAACPPSLFSAEERGFLLERGYLVSGDRQQQDVAAWFDAFKQRLRSFHFIVCPTLTCNLRCHYCYEPLDNRQSRTTMTPAHIVSLLRAMDRLIEERGAETVHLEFFGGEPFLRSHRPVVEAMMQAADERGWSLSGISNGTQLDAYVPAFARHAGAISQLQITLDGPRAIHDTIRVNARGAGSYDAICRNVSAMLDLDIPMVLRVNVGADTTVELPQLFAAFDAMGWTSYGHFHCQLAPINDHGCTGCVSGYQPEFTLLHQLHAVFDDWEDTRERYHVTLGYDMERRTSLLRTALYGRQSSLLRRHDLSGCSASNQHYVVFGADGLLYACPETVGLSETAIGRFHPDYALDRQTWSRWDVNIANTGKCIDCNIAPVCGGACPWHGFNASSFDAYEPHCNYASQTIATYLDVNRARILELVD